MYPVVVKTNKDEFIEKEFRETVTSKYESFGEGLTFEGLKDWFKDKIESEGEIKFREAICRMGYNQETLEPMKQRRFNLSIHSKGVGIEDGPNQLEVLIREAGKTEVDRDVKKLICLKHGTSLEEGEGYRLV